MIATISSPSSGETAAEVCETLPARPAASRLSTETRGGASTAFPRTSLRVRPSNPNHHLWNNNGTWYVHYTVHPTPFTKSRIRASLETKSLEVARRRRDEILFRAAALSE
jgi:hypothetical protein